MYFYENMPKPFPHDEHTQCGHEVEFALAFRVTETDANGERNVYFCSGTCRDAYLIRAGALMD